MVYNQVYSGTINSAEQALLPEAIESAAYQPSSAVSLHSEQTLITFLRNHGLVHSFPTKISADEILGILQSILQNVPHRFLKGTGETLFSPLPCPSLVCSSAGYSGAFYL